MAGFVGEGRDWMIGVQMPAFDRYGDVKMKWIQSWLKGQAYLPQWLQASQHLCPIQFRAVSKYSRVHKLQLALSSSSLAYLTTAIQAYGMVG